MVQIVAPRRSASLRLTFVPSFLRGFGGVEQVLVAQAVVAREAGWEVRVVSPRRLEPGGALERALQPHAELTSAERAWQRRPAGRVLRAAAYARERARTRRVPDPQRRATLAGDHARAYIESFWRRGAGRRLLADTDLVYVLAAHPFGAGAIEAAAALDVPVVYEVTSQPAPEWLTDPYYAPIRRALPLASAVLVRSSSVGEAVSQHHGYDGTITVLDQWVEPPLEADLLALAVAAPQHGPLRVGSLSRVVEGKGLEVLVEAAAQVVLGGVTVEVVIGGDGPLEAALAARAAELGLAEHVRLIGAVAPADRVGFYESVDVFVMASESEGGPVAPLEAMAAGRAVLSTAVGAMPDRLVEGESGRFFPVGDAGALAELLRRLDADRSEVGRLAGAGRAAYLRANTAAGQAARLDALWRSVLRR